MTTRREVLTLLGAAARRAQITALAARHAIPTAYTRREFVLEGGLVSYGPDVPDGFRNAGIYTPHHTWPLYHMRISQPDSCCSCTYSRRFAE
jgi:hypothetical protein